MNLGTRRISALGVSFALHVVVAIAVTWLTPVRTLLRLDASTPRVAFVQSPQTLDSARNEPAPLDRTPEDLGLQFDEGASSFSVPGFAFDFGKIARRAALLFPFLTGSASFERLVAPPQSGLIGWANLFRQLRGEAAKPPLVLGSVALQALIDKSWSRRERWRAFEPIAALADAYDSDAGSVPRLLREYGVQNGLQPYTEREIRDPRLWAQLGLAADHADFIGFVSQYASEHPASKATTELLFLLDKLAQASLDALVTLRATDPRQELQWTRRANPRAYDAIVTIREYFLIQLERRGLMSPEEIAAYYDGTRLAILGSILRTTPDAYRASDAHFLIGEIHWRHRKTEDAVRAWSSMVIDPADSYAAPSSQLLAALRTAGGRQISPRDVRRILEGEQGRWVMFSIARLRRFGYRSDAF